MPNIVQRVLPLSWRVRLSHIGVVDRMWYWLSTFGRPAARVAQDGITLDVPYRAGKDYIEEITAGTYEHEEWQLVRKTIAEHDGVFLDVGANIGWYSLRAAKMGRQVIAVEPARDCLKYLRRNLKLNPQLAERIKIEPVAASEVAGTANFNQAFVGMGGHSLIKVHKSYRSYLVRTVPLDDIIDRPVSMAKIDVEGNEPRVLLGMKRIVNEWHPALLVECFEEALLAGGYSIVSLLDILKSYGYTPCIVGKPAEPATTESVQEQLRFIRLNQPKYLAINLYCIWGSR